MLYKKASEMKPTPIPHCMGGEGTVMMERLLDTKIIIPLFMAQRTRSHFK